MLEVRKNYKQRGYEDRRARADRLDKCFILCSVSGRY